MFEECGICFQKSLTQSQNLQHQICCIESLHDHMHLAFSIQLDPMTIFFLALRFHPTATSIRTYANHIIIPHHSKFLPLNLPHHPQFHHLEEVRVLVETGTLVHWYSYG